MCLDKGSIPQLHSARGMEGTKQETEDVWSEYSGLQPVVGDREYF